MTEKTLQKKAQQVYDAIYEEEDARVCKDISDSACTDVPHNFFLNAGALAMGKLADAIANTKTTLPWLLTSVGAPAWIIAWLVPIRESGSMLPQLAIGGWVRRLPRRKWFYTAGAAAQALSLFAAALAVTTMQGLAAGISVLICVVAFSLARGFCSVASKDVVGKTVPKTRRGRVNGVAASTAGFGILLVATVLYFVPADQTTYAVLLGAAAVIWLAAALLYSSISEEPGAVEGGVNGLLAALSGFKLLRDDGPFRDFVIGRALLVGTALSAPFLVIMARERSESSLTFFLIAQGAAALLSGSFWGRFADWSSRLLLLVVSVAVALLGTGIFMADRLATHLTTTQWFLPLSFFVLMVLHDGVRLGRKTYLVDLGGADKRTDYVAVSNTIIGIVLLVMGALASILQAYDNAVAILVLSLLALAAGVCIARLPEVQSR